jgi:hypothetical protein
MTPDSSRAARDLLARLVSRDAFLGDAAPLVRERHEEVSRVGSRRDHVLALLGEGPARTGLINQLLGDHVLAENRIDLTGTVVSFRRGASDDYRVRLTGGAIEQYSHLPHGNEASPAALRLADVETRLPAAREAVQRADQVIAHDVEELNAKLAVAEAEIANARANADTRRQALVVAARELPVFHRAPPPWWAFWLWIPRLLLPFWKAARETYAQAARQLAVGEGKIAELERNAGQARRAVEQRRSSVGAQERAALDALEIERERALAQLAEEKQVRRQKFIAALHELVDMGRRGPDVEELDVTIGGEAIPAGLVLLEVNLRGHAEDRERAVRHLLDEADGWLAASPPPEDLVKQLTALRIVSVPSDQSLAQALATLRAERLRRIAARTSEAVNAARITLAAREDYARRSWSARLEAAESLRVSDPAGLAAQELQRSIGRITERTHLALEHGINVLEHELSLMETRWRERLVGTHNVDELRAAAAAINHEAPELLGEMQQNVRLALGGVVGGAVRDLAPDAVAGLAPRFEALGSRPPVVEPIDLSGVEVLAYLTRPGYPPIIEANWFSSLFRGFEQRRDEAFAQLGQRLEHLRTTCTAEILDAEPPITATLRASIEKLCGDAAARLAAKAEKLIQDEQEAVAREQNELAPVFALREELEWSDAGRGTGSGSNRVVG